MDVVVADAYLRTKAGSLPPLVKAYLRTKGGGRGWSAECKSVEGRVAKFFTWTKYVKPNV